MFLEMSAICFSPNQLNLIISQILSFPSFWLILYILPGDVNFCVYADNSKLSILSLSPDHPVLIENVLLWVIETHCS